MNNQETEEMKQLFIEKQKNFENKGKEGRRFLNAYLFQLDRIDSTHQLRNFFCKIGRKRMNEEIRELKKIKKEAQKELKKRKKQSKGR